VRTAGIDPAQFVFAATATDVDTVIVDGRTVVKAGRHLAFDVAAELASSLARLQPDEA
jgi:cytosine/adenosine deaminase-related metal-dependent hydrolase